FNVDGIYERRPGSDGDQKSLFFHHKYLNESLDPSVPERDICGTFLVKVSDPAAIPGVVEAIDSQFANSTYETKTESERSFQLSFVSMLGNVKRLVGFIAAVVVFSILLVTALVMTMSARERIGEVAVLKTLGFSPARILVLFLGESVLISVLGGVTGAAGA